MEENRGLVTFLALLLLSVAILLMVVAFSDETFRAWNFGQAAVLAGIGALVVVSLYGIWRK